MGCYAAPGAVDCYVCSRQHVCKQYASIVDSKLISWPQIQKGKNGLLYTRAELCLGGICLFMQSMARKWKSLLQ